VAGQRFSGKRNPDYYMKGVPYCDKFESLRFTSGDSSLNTNAFRSGNLDIIGGTPDVADDVLKTNPNTKLLYVPLDRSGDEVVLNTSFAPFKNKKVRQAFRKVIDWDVFPGLVKGKATVTAGLSLPSFEWDLSQDELKKARTRDVAGAKALMREAGMESGFDLKFAIPNYLANFYVTMAELIQSNLKDINVRSTIEPMDGATWFQRRATGQFEATVQNNGSLSATSADLNARYKPGGSLNTHGYDNPDLTKLIDQQATQSRDPEARKKTLQEIARLVLDDCILMNVMVRHQVYMTQPYLMDWLPNGEIQASQYHLATCWLDK
jgi:ABC-type transport system substrate-binding protein